MIKVKVHFVGKKDGDGVIRDQEFSLEEVCDPVDLEEFKGAFGECDLTIGIGTGKDKVEEKFLSIFALPLIEERKYNFKITIISGYFWFTWVEGQGPNKPDFAFGYSTAKFEYNGHKLEIEKGGSF